MTEYGSAVSVRAGLKVSLLRVSRLAAGLDEVPVPGSQRSMSWAANLPAPAFCIPGMVTRPGRACSLTSGVTCCTAAS